ncbi:MAG: hypothetical protein U9N06_01785 [candidate division WOR-3 bacterium]|nr:hypothetical protein [candidate division WOR-3 bacterium]
MKKLLIPLFVLVLIIGCGEKYDNPVGPYPTDIEGIVDSLIVKGWRAYKDGDYDLAYARFDSLVKIQSDNTEGYIGRGFSLLQEEKFEDALTSFDFATYLEGSPISKVEKVDLNWENLTSDSLFYRWSPMKTPLLGLLDPTIVAFLPSSWWVHVKFDTVGKSRDYEYTTSDTFEFKLRVDRFTQNGIVTPSVLLADSIWMDSLWYPDSTKVTVVWDTTSTSIYIPAPGEDPEVEAGYAYLSTEEMSTLAALALVGEAQADQLLNRSEGAPLMSTIYARAVLSVFPEDNPIEADSSIRYVDPLLTSENVRILLAQDYFYLKMYLNALWQVWILDPESKEDPSLDPSLPDFVYNLGKKIEGLYAKSH